jgi:cell division protease FtsH
MNIAIKNTIFWSVMALTALLIWAVVKSSSSQPIPNLTFTQFSHEIGQDNVREVSISAPGNAGIFSVQGVLRKGNTPFKTAAPANYTDWLKALTEKNVSITFDVSESNGWLTWLANGLPMILILGLWLFIWRRMQKGGWRWPQAPLGPGNS